MIDEEKIDDYTLALMYLVSHKDGFGVRAWKGHGWDVLDRLCEKGFISDPKTKAKSVALTPEGESKMKQLFEEFFMVKSDN